MEVFQSRHWCAAISWSSRSTSLRSTDAVDEHGKEATVLRREGGYLKRLPREVKEHKNTHEACAESWLKTARSLRRGALWISHMGSAHAHHLVMVSWSWSPGHGLLVMVSWSWSSCIGCLSLLHSVTVTPLACQSQSKGRGMTWFALHGENSTSLL
jgi:hypothetical protein